MHKRSARALSAATAVLLAAGVLAAQAPGASAGTRTTTGTTTGTTTQGDDRA